MSCGPILLSTRQCQFQTFSTHKLSPVRLFSTLDSLRSDCSQLYGQYQVRLFLALWTVSGPTVFSSMDSLRSDCSQLSGQSQVRLFSVLWARRLWSSLCSEGLKSMWEYVRGVPGGADASWTLARLGAVTASEATCGVFCGCWNYDRDCSIRKSSRQVLRRVQLGYVPPLASHAGPSTSRTTPWSTVLCKAKTTPPST